MKLYTVLICSVLLVQNNGVMGQSKSITTPQPNQPAVNVSNNTNNQSPPPGALSKVKSISSDLYEEVKKTEPGNFVLSPLSLTNALAMVSLGAAGETAKEILKALESKDNNQLIRKQSNLTTLLKDISSENSGVKFVSADKIYATDGLTVNPLYQNQVEGLGGEIEPVNFGNAEEAAGKINWWVKNKTEGKIEKLVDAQNLNSQTSLFVLNAIYFKGEWKRPFDNSSTRKRPFFINDSCSVSVDMMYQQKEFQYADLEEAKAQVIRLPYQGERLSMLIYLPNGKDESSILDLEKWLKDYSPFEIIQNKRLNRKRIGDVSLSLPKFKIRSTLELNEPLQKLGLGEMFNEATANFSGIFKGSGRFFVSKVSQKTFIDVNEKGTEAAAATGFEVGATSFTQTPQFTANRPFLFQIIDKETKTVLFMGRVKNPLDSGESTLLAGQAEEPVCVNAKETVSATTNLSTNVNETISTFGNETNTNVPCQSNSSPNPNHESDLEKMLMSFCSLTVSSNSTEGFKNNLTIGAAELKQCLKERVAEETRVIKSNQNLTITVKGLQSEIQQLKKKELERNKTAFPCNTEKTTKRPTEKTWVRNQGRLQSIQFPPAAAYGQYSWGGNGSYNGKSWNYNATTNGTCLSIPGGMHSAFIQGPSCVALYKDENCTQDKFQMDTRNWYLGTDIRIPSEFNKSIRSIGVCSS